MRLVDKRWIHQPSFYLGFAEFKPIENIENERTAGRKVHRKGWGL